MFKDQSIAITGANGGIGRAIAEMFIAQGAKVAISDLQTPIKTATEIGAIGFACDVTNEEAVQDFVDMAEAANGPIDVFVSNAGVGFGDPKNAAGASNRNWELSWQVNVMSSVYAARAVLPGMQERGSGRFIITASAAGLLQQIGSASYSATKHAAVSFAESIAIRHWDEGIRAHCICPQYVRTSMTKGFEFAEKHQDGLLEPSDVADALRLAMEKDEFLVLSHPVVGDYFKHKAMDYQAYIANMNKLKQKIGNKQLPE
jgi:NAD(P)-dependent dehydrogenase (short-subunit alcohol dehydrogenase family)